jgi:hypothetical protein
MKAKDLLEEIERCKKEYGEEFLEWDVYTEQCDEYDKESKLENNWETETDSEDWIYFKCHGFWTIMPEEKIFTINVNF